MSNSSNNKQLNILDILNARLRHTQQSTITTGTKTIPRVSHGHVNDGIHDLTYGYGNTNRVFHELVSNAKQAVKQISDKASLGNLSNYITTNDDLSSNKLVIGDNGTITDSRFLRFTNITPGVLTDIEGDIKAVHIVTENECVIITTEHAYAYDIVTMSLSKEPLADFLINDNEFVSTKLISNNVFQVVTTSTIIHYEIIHSIDEDDPIGLHEVFNVNLMEAYANKKLIILDTSRRQDITTILNTNTATKWFTDFTPLATTVMQTSSLTNSNEVVVQCLGILTGSFGIFELVQNSLGYYFVRVIDSDPVTTTLLYTKEAAVWLVAFNTIGVKCYKLDSTGVHTFSANVKDTVIDAINDNNWHWLPQTGNIPASPTSSHTVNVNKILEYGVDIDIDNDGDYANRIPDASVGDIQYAYYEDEYGETQVVLRDMYYEPDDDNFYRCMFRTASTGMIRLIHDYDLHEFNGFKEVSVLNAVKYDDMSDTHFLFNVKNVGLIHGERTQTSTATGMRLANIQKFTKVNNDNVNLMPVSQSVFVYNKNNDVLYSSAVDSDALLPLPSGHMIKPEYMSRLKNDFAFVVGRDQKNRLAVYRVKVKRYYSSTTNDLKTTLVDIITKNSTEGTLYDLHLKHLDQSHGENSAMTRLNKIIYDLQTAAISDSTVYIPDSSIAYISTGYSLANIERVITNKDSTYVYGRVNSPTTNAFIGMTTEAKRASDNVLFYDTVTDRDGNETSLNKLAYTAYRITDNMIKLDIDVPTTCTYYVNNIPGWSKGAHTGTTMPRPNLNNGYLRGTIENASTEYQLVLNREYFNIKRIINVNCQLASAPLGIYSDNEYFDALHYGMFDMPIVTPLCTTKLLDDNTYEMTNNQNNEVTLNFSIFGGDALTITVILETDETSIQ